MKAMLRMTNKQWAYTWPCALPVSVKLQMVMLIGMEIILKPIGSCDQTQMGFQLFLTQALHLETIQFLALPMLEMYTELL